MFWVIHIAFWEGVRREASEGRADRSSPTGGVATRRVPFPRIRFSSDQVPKTNFPWSDGMRLPR
jgi:hypothetical protein